MCEKRLPIKPMHFFLTKTNIKVENELNAFTISIASAHFNAQLHIANVCACARKEHTQKTAHNQYRITPTTKDLITEYEREKKEKSAGKNMASYRVRLRNPWYGIQIRSLRRRNKSHINNVPDKSQTKYYDWAVGNFEKLKAYSINQTSTKLICSLSELSGFPFARHNKRRNILCNKCSELFLYSSSITMKLILAMHCSN